MAIYKPNVEMFYGTVNSSISKISPAPNMSISINYDYAGDSIIGYTYEIQLTGQISILDLSNLSYGDTYIPSDKLLKGGLGTVSDKINRTRALFSQNGNILHITDAKTQTPFFKAKGGILRSFDVSNSNNSMTTTANFTAVLEFNEIEINDTQNAASNFLDNTGFPNNNKGILDVDEYKIKSFTDSWSFSFNEEVYNVVEELEYSNLRLDNSFFTIEYTANATGKNYYEYSNEDNSTAKLIPAWEQAKNFVQTRLYYQVKSLIGGMLKKYDSTGCTSSDGLDDINTPNDATKSGGLLEDLESETSTYKVYNEEITCDFSESAGSFGVTYKCIVRRNHDDYFFTDSNVFHTITKSEKSEGFFYEGYNGRVRNKVVSINGRIEGLVEGGIINFSKPLQLPATGSFLINQTSNPREKSNNANSMLNKVIFNNDLNPSLKSLLNILGDLRWAYLPNNEDPDLRPSSLSLTTDATQGTIDYVVEYDTNNYRCNGVTTTIDIQDSVPTYAVYELPGSGGRGVLHKLGTRSAKKVTVTQEYYNSPSTTDQLLSSNLSDLGNFSIANIGNIPYDRVTDATWTEDPLTGKNTVSITYYCTNVIC